MPINNPAAGEHAGEEPDKLETATVQIPVEVLEFLREAARKRKVSTGDMVRIALSTHKYLAEQEKNGAKVQIRDRFNRLYDIAIEEK